MTHRYVLHRDCSPLTGVDRLVWVMLNPSTADDTVDDPTIRRVIGFTDREGCAALDVVNLWAMRATDPKALRAALDAGGSVDDSARQESAWVRSIAPARTVVAAWGAFDHPAMAARIDHVLGIAKRFGTPVVCLGTTKGGAPRHPLYVRSDQPFEPWLGGAS